MIGVELLYSTALTFAALFNIGFVVTWDDSSLGVILLLLALDGVGHFSQCTRWLQS